MKHSTDGGASHAALENHCRRVAGVATQLAALLELPSETGTAVRRAALAHHSWGATWRESSRRSLLQDVIGAPGAAMQPSPAETPGFASAPDPVSGAGGRIFELAHAFDELIEFLPYEDRSVQELTAEFASQPWWSPEVVHAFDACYRVRPENLDQAAASLPVFPRVLMELARACRDPRATGPRLAAVLKQDAVLVAELLRVANSPLYGATQAITTPERALSYLGLNTTLNVLMALSARPWFASSRLAELWRHSVTAGATCSQVARLTGAMDPQEGYVVGLLHDIGRILLEKAGIFAQEPYASLLEDGCFPCYAEYLVCRADHGEAGANLLSAWNLPEGLVSAIRYHHRPELAKSPGADLLYLTEWLTDADEDLPSVSRLHGACERLNITLSKLQGIESDDMKWVQVVAA